MEIIKRSGVENSQSRGAQALVFREVAGDHLRKEER